VWSYMCFYHAFSQCFLSPHRRPIKKLGIFTILHDHHVYHVSYDTCAGSVGAHRGEHKEKRKKERYFCAGGFLKKI
jgi:hypothetical protein